MGFRDAMSRVQGLRSGVATSSSSVGIILSSTGEGDLGGLLGLTSYGEYGVDKHNSNHIQVEGSPNHDLTKPPGELTYEVSVSDSFTRQPVQDDNNIYVGSDTLISVSKSDGSVNWEFGTGEGVNLESSPVLLDELLVAGVGENKLIAVDYNGNEQWRFEVPDDHSSGNFNKSPAFSDMAILAPNTNGRVYFLGAEGELIGSLLVNSGMGVDTPAIYGDEYNQGAIITASDSQQMEAMTIDIEKFIILSLDDSSHLEYHGGPPVKSIDNGYTTSSVSIPTAAELTNLYINESGYVTGTVSTPSTASLTNIHRNEAGGVTGTTSTPSTAELTGIHRNEAGSTTGTVSTPTTTQPTSMVYTDSGSITSTTGTPLESPGLEVSTTLNGGSAELMVYEDIDADGAYENSQTVTLVDGVNEYDVPDLALDSGNNIWYFLNADNNDITSTVEIEYVSVA